MKQAKTKQPKTPMERRRTLFELRCESPGLYYGYKIGYSVPFCKLESPSRRRTTKWSLTYRDGDKPEGLEFDGPVNVTPTTRADAEYEIGTAVVYSSDYQLGLTAKR